MADPVRQRKIEDRIRTTVAKLLERRIKDSRLGFVTITDCRITGDLQHATVFYTVYGKASERKQTAHALRSATGIIRSEVGKVLRIRLTPTIEFVADALPEQAASFESTLANAKKHDEELAAKAQTAQYAGEADPYKKPRVKEEELDLWDQEEVDSELEIWSEDN